MPINITTTPPFSLYSTLLDIRKKLVLGSGHYDLVEDPEQGLWADRGANDIINDAARWLDRQLEYHKSDAWLYLLTSDPVVAFRQARIIKEVWVVADSHRSELRRVSFKEMRKMWPTLPKSDYAGRPTVYAPAPIGLSPEQWTETANTFSGGGLVDYDHIYFGNHHPWRGFIVSPPPNSQVQLEVLAQWYPRMLTLDSDINFWTVQHPDLLVRAARLQIEIDLHRNTQGQTDFEGALLSDLRKVADDLISEQWQGPPERFVVRG